MNAPTASQQATDAGPPQRPRRRLVLWTVLVVLLVAAQSLLLTLTLHYRAAHAQEGVEAAAEIATGQLQQLLAANLQALLSLPGRAATEAPWQPRAATLLVARPELLRLERRDPALHIVDVADTRVRPPLFGHWRRSDSDLETELACGAAQRRGGPSYSHSYFVPQGDGTGLEVMDLCIAEREGDLLRGFLVASYSLTVLLDQLAAPVVAPDHDLSFVEPDGARLARGRTHVGAGVYDASRMVDLPGTAMQLRVDSAATRPSLLPDLVTGLVVALSLALFGVIALLGRDARKRARAEAAQRRVEEVARLQQERLQATARLATVGEMASLLSHELNQPLSAIAAYATGSLNMMDAQARGEPPEPDLWPMLHQASQRIAEQAERAGRVIKSVHDFVRRRQQAREAVAADVLIDAVLPLVRLQARKSGTRIELDIDAPAPKVLCDRAMVEQVLLNLTRNGIQAMQASAGADEPVLTLRVRQPQPQWVHLTVADRGPGVDDGVARQLFTPFFTTRSDGMGLGLSVCRTIVEQHGGALDFANRRDAAGAVCGAEFRFTLPAAGTEPKPAGHGEAPTDAPVDAVTMP